MARFWIAEDTTVPGFSHAVARWRRSGGGGVGGRCGILLSPRSAAWLAVGLAGFVLTVVQVFRVVQGFFEYPVDTKISVVSDDEIQFPLVTVCNYKKLHCGRLIEVLNETEEIAKRATICRVYRLAECSPFNNLGEVLAPEDICSGPSNSSSNGTRGVRDLGSIYKRITALDDAISLVHPTVRNRMTWSKEDMLADCFFNGRKCNDSDINSYIPQNFGTCVGFNYFGAITTRETHRTSGLTMILKVDIDDRIKYGSVGNKGGMAVFIQRPRSITKIAETGIDVQPNTVTGFALEQTEMILKPAPYPSGCISSWPETTVPIVNLIPDAFNNAVMSIYDQQHCSDLCQITASWKACGHCTWRKYDRLYLRQFASLFNYSAMEMPECQESNATVMACLKNSAPIDTVDQCNCRPQCSQPGYKITASSAKWPTEFDWKELGESYGVSMPELPKVPDDVPFTDHIYELWWKNRVYNSLMKVDVYFSSKNRLVTAQVPKYSGVWDHLGALGGSMSIFMGLSFVAVAEIAEAAVDAMWGAGAAAMARRRRKVSPEKPPK